MNMSLDRIKDYDAIRQGVALGSVDRRVQLAVAGPDRASYLQGLLTNDVQALQPGSGCYSVWLTPQGRMLSDMHVLQSDTMTLLDVPADIAASLLQRLDQFLFTENVQLQSLADSLASVWVHGPLAPTVLARVLEGAADLEGWPDYRHARVSPRSDPEVAIVLARIDQLGVPGFVLYVDAPRRDALEEALVAEGACRASAEAIEAARMESAYPVFGIDMTDDTIPLEAGIENRAISFTKGCYVGQEVIIRVLHRGGGRVARKLVTLRIDGGLPSRGARLYTAEREIGFITSAADSPRLGPIALAYVHRDFVTPGTPVLVDINGDRVPASVTERPLSSAA
jgi:folate-binding protein YgfZ